MSVLFTVGAALVLAPQGLGALTDVPISGRLLKLRASQTNPAGRALAFRSVRDAAITAPIADPAQGASLFIFSSNAQGQCRAEIPLPAGNWEAIGNDGPNRGWRYRNSAGGAAGIRKVIIKPRPGGGKIVVKGRGSQIPCGLAAAAQAEPVSIALRLGDTRYCAAFGGTVKRNTAGRFRAVHAPAPAACPDADLSAANLNVLHGLFCPSETGFCRLEDRIDLLGQWIVERGCPDVLAFQEVFDNVLGSSSAALMQDRLADVCSFPYEVIYTRASGVDDSLLLSRYPALGSEVEVLFGVIPIRNVLYARLDHAIGPIDVFSTHLASGSDLGSNPCGESCPQECLDAGAGTIRDCQAVQAALFVEARHDVDGPAVLMGDFNAGPGTFVYDEFVVKRGWVDTYLASGNPECAPATGVGCTSGREGDDLTDLESPGLNVRRRIDYVFLVPPGTGSTCAAVLDSPADDDGDGVATRLFADEPNTFGLPCGTAPAPICWVSDHSGVQADVNCD